MSIEEDLEVWRELRVVAKKTVTVSYQLVSYVQKNLLLGIASQVQ